MLSLIAKLVAALNANSRPAEVAAAGAFGILLALVPGGNLLWFTLLLIVFFLKVHLATALLVMGLGKLVLPLADPLLSRLGLLILQQEALIPLFTRLINTPVVPFTSFNNSLVMGGLAAGIVLWIPLFLLLRPLIGLYRNAVRPKIAESRLVKAFVRYPLINKIGKAARRAGGLYSRGA